jgi:hypothetical protein
MPTATCHAWSVEQDISIGRALCAGEVMMRKVLHDALLWQGNRKAFMHLPSQSFARSELPEIRPRSTLRWLEHPVLEDVDNLLQGRLVVDAKVIGHPEQQFDTVILDERSGWPS